MSTCQSKHIMQTFSHCLMNVAHHESAFKVMYYPKEASYAIKAPVFFSVCGRENGKMYLRSRSFLKLNLISLFPAAPSSALLVFFAIFSKTRSSFLGRWIAALLKRCASFFHAVQPHCSILKFPQCL